MKYRPYAQPVAIVVLGLLCALVFIPSWVQSQTTTDITGWAWGEAYVDANFNGTDDAGDQAGGVGWISLNCATGGPTGNNICASRNYKLQVDNNTGTVSGYAWSDNVGWISASAADLAGCPAAPCTLVVAGNNLQGWMRVISGNDADTTKTGGWDGFISVNGSGYGISKVNSAFTGWAWGSTNVGWVDFSSQYPCATTAGYMCVGNVQSYKNIDCSVTPVQTCYQCDTGTNQCIPPPSPTGSITASPRIVNSNSTTQIIWNSADADYCEVAGTNSDKWSGTGTNVTRTSSVISVPTTYTLSCSSSWVATTTIGSVTVTLVPKWKEY